MSTRADQSVGCRSQRGVPCFSHTAYVRPRGGCHCRAVPACSRYHRPDQLDRRRTASGRRSQLEFEPGASDRCRRCNHQRYRPAHDHARHRCDSHPEPYKREVVVINGGSTLTVLLAAQTPARCARRERAPRSRSRAERCSTPGGTIEALDGSTVRLIGGAVITGGTLSTAGTALITTPSGGRRAGKRTLNGVDGFHRQPVRWRDQQPSRR